MKFAVPFDMALAQNLTDVAGIRASTIVEALARHRESAGEEATEIRIPLDISLAGAKIVFVDAANHAGASFATVSQSKHLVHLQKRETPKRGKRDT